MARADTDPADLARQAWIMYSVGITMIVCRLIAQVRRVGFRRLASDDYVMVLSALLYTTLILTLIRSTEGIGGNGETDADVALMSQDEINTHIENAKFVNIAEHAMLCTIYSLKVCMLIIYSRLTMGLKERMAVKILAGYTITGFIASEITMIASCVPYTKYWAVPVGDAFLNQCAYYKHYSIAQAVFNTTSDAMMLAIPLPLLLRSRLPTKQKIAMVIVFSMGMFVILAAILSKALSLLPENYTTITYAFWYLRESSVAIYVANLPLLWPMIHKVWSYISRKTGLGSSTKDSRLYPTGGNPHTGDLELKSTTMASRRMKSQKLPDDESLKWDGNSSQERIIREERNVSAIGGSGGFGLAGGITKEETFEVTVSNVSESTDFGGHRQAVPYRTGKDSGNGRRRGDDVDYKIQVN